MPAKSPETSEIESLAGKFTAKNGTETFKAFAFMLVGAIAIYVLKLPADVVSSAFSEFGEVLGVPVGITAAVGALERLRKDR